MNRTELRCAATLLVAALAVGPLVACGGDDGSAAATTAAPAPSSSAAAGVTTAVAADSSDAPDVAVVVDRTMDQMKAAGFEAERACVEAVVRKLSPADLALLAAAAPGEDPDLSAEGDALGGELGDCVAAAGASSAGDQATGAPSTLGIVTVPTVAATEAPAAAGPSGRDACQLLTADDLAVFFAGLDGGAPSSVSTPYGDGDLCTWSGPAGQAIRVIVLPQGSLDSWRAEATDGDGADDGTVITGIGDEAYVRRGAISFAKGPRLVLFTVFPTFDVTEDQLAAVAGRLDAQV